MKTAKYLTLISYLLCQGFHVVKGKKHIARGDRTLLLFTLYEISGVKIKS